MKVQDGFAAGALVKIVDVLGHEGELRHVVRHRGDRDMSRIRLGAQYADSAPFVPAPNQLGIVPECLRRCEIFRVEALPKTREGVAEGRNATFGRSAGAAQHDHVPGGSQRSDQVRWDVVRAGTF